MTRMYDDWGELDERWRGIRSERWVVRGVSIHVLCADATAAGATAADAAAADGTAADVATDGAPADGEMAEGAAADNAATAVPTQVLVHGLGGSASNWLDVIPQLRRHGPVVAPDLPGFGQTEPLGPGASKLRNNLVVLAALTMSLTTRPVVLHGNSMGGSMAAMLAAKRPDLVERLVLVDPAVPAPRTALLQMNPQTFVTFAPFALPRVGRLVVDKMHESFTANQELIYADPSRLSPAMQTLERDNVQFAQQTPWRLTAMADAAESIVAALLGRRWLLQAVDAVQCPTLVLWGDQDQLVGARAIDATFARQPDWDLVVLPGVGHCPNMEAPGRYVESVERWYAASAAAASATTDPEDRTNPAHAAA